MLSACKRAADRKAYEFVHIAHSNYMRFNCHLFSGPQPLFQTSEPPRRSAPSRLPAFLLWQPGGAVVWFALFAVVVPLAGARRYGYAHDGLAMAA